MKKQMLSILLCLCMVFSILPTTAMAADTSTAPEKIYICGMTLTDGKCLVDNSADVTDYTGGNYVALYKGGVLYLNGLEKTYAGQARGYRTLNWDYSGTGKHDLVIELVEGSINKLVDTNYGAINGASGWSGDGPSLTIQGKGTLNVTGGTYAIWVWEGVTIQKGATVNATGGTKSGISINDTSGAITVKQGTTVTTSGKYGISGSNGRTVKFNIEGGNLVVKGTTQALYDTAANIDSSIDVYVSSLTDPTQASDVTTWNKTDNLVSSNYKYISLSGFGSAVNTYSVTKAATENGSFDVDYDKSMADETVTISATPNSGYEIDTVTVTDADNVNVTVNGTGNTRSFTMPAKDVTVSVSFKAVAAPTYTVTVTNGTSDKATAAAGEAVTITAEAAPTGKRFKEWTGADSLTFTSGSKTSATATFTMPAEAVNVTAAYEDIPVTKYTVTVIDGTSDKATAAAGETVTITAKAAPSGKVFYKWRVVDATLADAYSKTTTFTMPANDVTVAATYKVDTNDWYNHLYWMMQMLYSQKFDITASATNGGKIDPEGITKVQYSKSITYTITPDAGYAIKYVLVDGIDVGAVSTYTFKNVTQKHTIHAIFEQVNPYTDVKTNDWFYEDVIYVTRAGLMEGTGNSKFSPDITTDRAMLVTVLWRLEGCPVVDSPVVFDDVADGLWYSEAIDWASAYGIVNGYGNGRFGPTDKITREQIMAILNRYAAYKRLTEGTALTTLAQYKYSDWAESNVIWAESNGLLDNLGVNVSDMTAKASRAEMAAYLHRFMKNIIK